MAKRRPPPPTQYRAQRQALHDDLLAGRLSLSEAARRMRRLTGMDQAAYARWLGVAPRTYIDLERGVGNPTLRTLEKIARPFGLQVVFRPEAEE